MESSSADPCFLGRLCHDLAHPLGRLRRQPEPGAGTDTTSIATQAVRKGDRYVVNGQKVWTSRAEHSDLMLLLARTTPREQTKKRTEGLSVFLVDMRSALGKGLTIRPIRTMMNHNSCELFFDNMEVPAENLVGTEGRGFRYILDGMNAERILIAAECIGDARWFTSKSVAYASERKVFGRPIGQNQGVQFPIARAHIETVAAEMMVRKATALFAAGLPCGEDANMAKLLAADASWNAAEACMAAFGGFGLIYAVIGRVTHRKLLLDSQRIANESDSPLVGGPFHVDSPAGLLGARTAEQAIAQLDRFVPDGTENAVGQAPRSRPGCARVGGLGRQVGGTRQDQRRVERAGVPVHEVRPGRGGRIGRREFSDPDGRHDPEPQRLGGGRPAHVREHKGLAGVTGRLICFIFVNSSAFVNKSGR